MNNIKLSPDWIHGELKLSGRDPGNNEPNTITTLLDGSTVINDIRNDSPGTLPLSLGKFIDIMDTTLYGKQTLSDVDKVKWIHNFNDTENPKVSIRIDDDEINVPFLKGNEIDNNQDTTNLDQKITEFNTMSSPIINKAETIINNKQYTELRTAEVSDYIILSDYTDDPIYKYIEIADISGPIVYIDKTVKYNGYDCNYYSSHLKRVYNNEAERKIKDGSILDITVTFHATHGGPVTYEQITKDDPPISLGKIGITYNGGPITYSTSGTDYINKLVYVTDSSTELVSNTYPYIGLAFLLVINTNRMILYCMNDRVSEYYISSCKLLNV